MDAIGVRSELRMDLAADLIDDRREVPLGHDAAEAREGAAGLRERLSAVERALRGRSALGGGE